MEEQITDEGMYIFERRKAFIDQFIPIFNRFYNLISLSNENVSLNYISQLQDNDLYHLLKTNRKKDIVLGYTTVGIHRDDLEMLLNNFPIKKQALKVKTKLFRIHEIGSIPFSARNNKNQASFAVGRYF